MAFRFIHTADIHLDSPLRSLAMRDADLAALIGGSTRKALVAIVDLCIEEQVDALIIAGDLYDGDQTSMKTARYLVEQLERLHRAGVVVYKIRGNHDALSKITQELIFPPTIKVFGGRAEAVEFRKTGFDVLVHGMSFAKSHAPDSLLPKYGKPRPYAVNIGIMHTSLAGAPGHDPYAPCAIADLHDWGFDYWALGHIHARSEYHGASAIVMPGMPQGRDIGEAGPKTVTLVTIKDDRSICTEQRATNVAQFERIPIDLSGATSWPEVVDKIESKVGVLRDATGAPHLVGRLSLVGRTPLAWRLRRDRELLMTELQHRFGNSGRTWIDKIEISAETPLGAAISSDSADPVSELGSLIRREISNQDSVRESVRALVREMRDDLPLYARQFCGEDESEFESFIDRLLVESAEEISARLEQNGFEHR